MKIAIFTDTFLPQVNGVSNTLGYFSRYLSQRGIEHLIFVPDDKEAGVEAEEYPAVRFPSLPFALYPQVRLALPTLSAIRARLQAFRPDVVHIATEFSMGLSGLKAARQLGLPIVMSYHTNFDQYLEHYKLEFLEEPLWQYMRWFHSFALTNFCPSQNTLRRLTFRRMERLAVWSRGIDRKRFSPAFASAALRRELGAEDKLLYLYVGRISAEKGIDVYAQSIRAFNAKHPGRARFVFTGDGPYLETLQAMQIENTVCTGALHGRALSQVYASCDVFVFPSDNETFGNVMLEAMASGAPGICADAGGLKDFTAHGENAYVCAPRDAAALTEALEAMMDERLREKLRAGALRTASERSWERIFENLLAQYPPALPVSKAV